MRKWILLIVITLIVAAVIIWLKWPRHSGIICKKPYALCTSAQCIPDPRNKEKAICFCKVHEGNSLGKTECVKRSPYVDTNGVRHIVSTFSLKEFPEKKILQCPSGSPWANCLDMPCVVDPMDPSKAICSCIIKKSEPFVTLGGKCDQNSCGKGFWSGATIDDNEEFTEQLQDELEEGITPHQCGKS